MNRGELLGKSITITIPTQNPLMPRYLNGKITRVGTTPTDVSGERYSAYILTVESDLWPMKLDRNMRIFQNKTVPEIIISVLREFGVAVESRLTETYRVWEYCVQYQESSLSFISRLMELEGIAYHFSHSKHSHTLVLTDSLVGFKPFPGYDSIPYHYTSSGGTTEEEGIGQWLAEDCVTPGLSSTDDYDFRKPNAWMFQARQNPVSLSPGNIDVFEWPGRYIEHRQGEYYAKVRQERWAVEHQHINGVGTATGISPGHTFELISPSFPEDNSAYLVTTATYQFEENPYASSSAGGVVHHIRFAVIPADIPYRPEPVTQWPRTFGPQTARVTGPEGESIWTDKYGRIKVKFHWDRRVESDDTSSCWVRVSSAWAGQGFGGIQIPRVGDEVIVDFINGDPDRPIVTGRVYNEACMPPWDLPAAATIMGFRTQSKDGHSGNSSHLLFEDNPGSETVDLHAERDLNISVENHRNVKVEGNQYTSILGEQQKEVMARSELNYRSELYTIVGGPETRILNSNLATTIKNGRSLNIQSGGDKLAITGGQVTRIIGPYQQHVTENVTQCFESEVNTTIKGNKRETHNGSVDIHISKDWTQTINGETTIKNKGKWSHYVEGELILKSPHIIIDSPSVTYTHNEENSFWNNVLSVKVFSATFKVMDVSVVDFSASVKGVTYNNTGFDLSTKEGQVEFVGSVKSVSSPLLNMLAGLTIIS
ncbi:TPA: type VI secretion system tip protein VgrG [Escherichia coli]|nr:type VI secretion system tip protein VgrG [Escherichia coli]